MTRVAVIGGGVGGAAAARRLAQEGCEVVLLERSATLGGLVVSFSVAGTPLECFYHHVFPHESEIIGLIDEMGLTPKLEWLDSKMGVLVDGKIWPFTSPLDLLRFGPLPFVDRVRTGVGALLLGRVKQWDTLDARPARDWLAAFTGSNARDLVWDPLLRAKFGDAAPRVPAAWMWGRFQQRAGARKSGGEKLGYLRGGFRQLFDAVDADLRARGVDVRLNTSVDGLVIDGTRVRGVRVGDETISVDDVLYAGTLTGLTNLVPLEHHDPRWNSIDALGVQCVVLEMTKPLTDVYWTNVCDQRLPFGGIIEHTNMLPKADYGGRHVVYLSRYFTLDEPIAKADPAEETERWLDALAAHYPRFARDDVLAVHPFKTMYGAPLVTLGHAARIPPAKTHLDGLTITTTAQIYPQDRGMSEGVRHGIDAAELVLRGTAWECPVCDGGVAAPHWTDVGGANADDLRPSAEQFGATLSATVRCVACGHISLATPPADEVLSESYEDTADPVSLREEAGQVETGRRTLAAAAPFVTKGRMLDLGCWTGSLLVAARELGWEVHGVEPSTWASDRARARGVDVRTSTWHDHGQAEGSVDLVAMCDVLEHLIAPGDALDEIGRVLTPGGALLLTVPDAGSRLARTMGKRWWSVLPMHVQYFTRASLTRLLERHGFDVRLVTTHAKVFSARYYAERFGGYSKLLERATVGAVAGVGQGDRLVAPDFRDRMLVIATRKEQ